MTRTLSAIVLTLFCLHPLAGFCADMDRNNLTDEEELEIGTDPSNPDSDGDGLGMDGKRRYLLEIGYPSDPNKGDTDGGWCNELQEYEADSDPNDPVKLAVISLADN